MERNGKRNGRRFKEKIQAHRHGIPKPPTAEESLGMLKNSNPFEAVFMFVKYAIKHFIKQPHKSEYKG